jgi:lipopolysaccharide export system permease protein
MLKKLDIYIAKKFLGTIVFILLMAAIISTIFDISEKTEDFIRNNLSLKTIVFDYYIGFIPNIINLISPLLIFISALYFTARLANNSEIVAMLASGISYYRLLRPYLLVSLLLFFLDLGLKNFVLPKAYDIVNTFEQKYVIQGYNYNYKNIHRQMDGNSFFYIQNFDITVNKGYKLTIEDYNNNKLTNRLSADEAYYDTVKKVWALYHWNRRYIDSDNIKDSLATGDTMYIKIPITRSEFDAKTRNAPGLTTPELIKFIESERFRGEGALNYYLIELNKRFSLPFAIIVLILIAVSIATRKIRGGIGSHLLIGILIAVCYELFMRFSTTFSTNANLPPIVSVWIPNLVFLVFGLYLLWRTPK